MTSDKCINKIKEDKIIFNCNYSEYEVSKMKFLIFVNYESNIKKISNFKETKENKKPEFNFILLLIIVSVIIISIIVLLIIRKPKKNVFDNTFNEIEGLLPNK
jgi:subtilase family serine protease